MENNQWDSEIVVVSSPRLQIKHEVCGYVLYQDDVPIATTTGDPENCPHVSAPTLLGMFMDLAQQLDINPLDINYWNTNCSPFCITFHNQSESVLSSDIELSEDTMTVTITYSKK